MQLKISYLPFTNYPRLFASVLMTILACCLWAQDQHDHHEAITKLVGDYQEARENMDAEQLATLLTDDADQLVSSGVWRNGKDDLVKGMQMSSRNNAGERSITVDKIRFVSDDVAIADAEYVIANPSAGTERRMWSTFVVKRAEHRWLISAIRNMLPATASN